MLKLLKKRHLLPERSKGERWFSLNITHKSVRLPQSDSTFTGDLTLQSASNPQTGAFHNYKEQFTDIFGLLRKATHQYIMSWAMISWSVSENFI